MDHPNLVFTINKKEDLGVALAFRTMKAGGIDFRTWGLLAPHPELRKHARLTRSVLAAYVDQYYLLHAADLERTRMDFARIWRSVAGGFFSLTGELFGPGFPPPGAYTCSVSIWNCNPRDIRHRYFQVFFRHIRPRETMVHEMLHFAFYAYVFKRYPHTRHPDHTKVLWDLSEAFNTVVLNDPRWRKRLRLKRQPPYPELRGLVRTMRQRWAKNRSLDELLDGFIGKTGSPVDFWG